MIFEFIFGAVKPRSCKTVLLAQVLDLVGCLGYGPFGDYLQDCQGIVIFEPGRVIFEAGIIGQLRFGHGRAQTLEFIRGRRREGGKIAVFAKERIGRADATDPCFPMAPPLCRSLADRATSTPWYA